MQSHGRVALRYRKSSRTPTALRHATGRPTAIDLFTGAGGLSLGFEQAGFDVVASLDSDPVHAAVHRYNFPLTPSLCKDVREVSGDELLTIARTGFENLSGSLHLWRHSVDVVFGGPPCQGFSSIGAHDEKDERNDLIFEFGRLVREIRPKYFVMENVAGILYDKYAGLLDRFAKTMRQAGYIVAEPQLLNAANYGVPQHRERVILIGRRRGLLAASHPKETTLPIATLRRPSKAHSLPATPTVAEALEGLPSIDSLNELFHNDELLLTSRDLETITNASSRYARYLSGTEYDPSDFSYRRSIDRGTLTCTMRTKHRRDVIARFAKAPKGKLESVSRFFKLDDATQTNTLRAGTGVDHGSYTSARPIHFESPRVITVREAARLHSFPDWFRFHRTKWHGFREVGNSVPPLLGRAIAREIIRALGRRPLKPRTPLSKSDASLLDMSARQAAEAVRGNNESLNNGSQGTSRKATAPLGTQRCYIEQTDKAQASR